MRQTGVQDPEAGWGGPERGSSRSPLGRPGPYPRLIAGLALAVPFVIMPMPAQGNAQSATYRVTFEGKFTASALASGVSVPSGEHFTTLIGAVHNDSVTFWSSGGTASAGIESMAEVGGTSALKSEINASSNALAVIEKSLPSGGTPTATVDFTVTTAHPLVTLLSMIAPSPDWFVGVSGLSLRNDADDGWQPSLTVDLFPYDAGTEEGTEFSLSNAATSPQGTIASIKGTGKFSNEPIATLSFLRLTPLITSPSLFAVDENGTAVATLSATDTETDSDELTWSIPSGDAGGADADKFTLSSTGVLTFNAAKDYENPDDSDTDRTYEVTVQVSDGDNTDTATLTVTVENVIELTTLTGPSSSDYAENGATRVATYIASSDEDRDGIDWILTGNDARHFTIDSPRGALRFDIAPVAPKIFAEPPDFEDPDDTDTNNDYEVTLLARVGTTLSSTLSVTVTVTDVDEDGAITLSTTRPRMGEALAATLVDPDGVTGAVAYSWERSASRSAWVTITGANTASYTPAAAETGHFLRVTATYTDGHGADNTATATAAEVVTAQLLSGLTATTTNSTGGATWRQMNPAFDAHTLHYAVGCGDSDTMTVTLTAADSAARVAVDLRQTANRNTTVEVAVTGSSDVPITLTGTDGAHTTYVVHCIPDDFMEVTTIKRVNTGVMEDLIMFGRHYGDDGGRQDGKTYMTIIDNNGVPRFLRPLEYRVSLFFRYHKTEDGPWRYSYGKGNNLDGEIVILNQNLEEVTRVTTVAPLTKTNYHDHHILDDGNYLLMSYQPETRDLSHLVGFLDRNGDPMTYGMAEDVSDSAIQIVTPDSKAVFTWNSWDGMEIEDCAAHRFPPAFMDYAHVNGLQLFDGDIIATFRGCSKVLRIDPDPNNDTDHKVVWRLGRSNLSDEQWLAGDKGPPPMKFVGDPEGEFCGMHAGKLLPNGNLLIFDNGTDCLIDPRTRVSQRVSNEFSRAVEYAIDEVNGEAIYLRAHSLHGTEAYLTWSSGNVEYLANGDWLISWGRSPTTAQVEGGSGAKPDESATQVDPDTGVEKFSIRVTNTGTAGGQQGIRAIPLSPVALADEPVPLAAEIVESAASSVFHLGPTDAPQVVVAFNQPVVDPDPAATTWPWVNVQGATIESVVSHIVPGEPANAYLFTLTPTGVGPITFGLVADPPCASGGICTADGTLLSEAPASHVIPARSTGPPVMSITSSATHPAKDGFTVTITFSEPVTGLTANEIEVTNGTGSNFLGSGAVYTLEITPDAGIEDDVTVTVTVGAVVDPLNNGNLAASEAFPVDTKAPVVSTVAITSNPGPDATYAPGDVIEVTVTFDEAVVVAGRPRLTLNVGGGNRTANYQSGVDATLLFSYTVADGESDADGVSIEADSLSRNGGTIQDEADNDAVLDHEALAADSSHKVDGVKPELTVTDGAVVDGATLTLTYNETLDGSSTPEMDDFTVAGGNRALMVSRVAVRGATVELTLDSGAEHEEAGIQVSYTPGMNPIRDVPGNEAEALSHVPVTNDTPDTTSPTVSSLAITSNPGSDQTYAEGDEIEVTLTFDETVEVEGTPQLRLKMGTRTRTAGYDSGTGTAALVFGYEVAVGDEDTVGVNIEAGRIALNGGTIEDEADNDAVLDHEAVAPQAGHQVDGVRPAFVSAAVDGSSLTLTYGEALDEGSRPASGDFTVQVDGIGRSVSGVSVSGSVVTLTLNPAVAQGDTGIRVSYAPDTNPIRDAVGNDALALSNRSVTNTTEDPNTVPEITSPSSFDVPENQAMVRRLAARDTDPGDEVTGWAIVGGTDQGQFTITTDTGDLRFRTAPDFEAPGDNEYEVTVEVMSGAGARELEAEQTFTLRVTDEREPPGIPEAPTFSGETVESMTVNWSEPDNTGPPITDYDVQYREGGGFTDAQHEGPGLALTLSDLKAGTVYEVQVRARNDEGMSDWSESGEGMTVTPLTVQMTPSPPPPVEAPFTMRFSFSEEVRGFTSGDIETQQEPACTDSGNNPVSCNPGFTALQSTDNRIFTITVTPRTERVAHNYTLTITVGANTVISTLDNKPNEAATLEVRVAPPGVTVPISSIGLTANPGNSQVTLRWNTPTNTGGAPIVRYEYRWAESGGEFNAWVSVAPAERSATVRELTNGREYMFEVRPVNALGYGLVTTARAAARSGGGGPPGGGGSPGGGGGPRQTVPSAPINLVADATDGAATLTWEAPENDGGSPITDYEYQIDGKGRWISIGSTDTTHTVTGLDNDTVYTFQVRAVNRIGKSFSSNRAEATPEAPEVFTLDFAHFANGTGITSDFVFVNVSPHPIRPALYFYDQEGDLIDPESVVDVTGDLEVAEDGSLSVLTEMEPLGELTISTHGQGELVSGSVKVLSDGPIGGGVRYGVPEIGVAVVGASPPVRDVLFPARRQEGGIRTAAALHNLGEEAVEARCELMREGVLRDFVSISLEANGQTSWLIDQAFPAADTSDFTGSVRCDAVGQGLFSAVALEMDPGTRIFTTLPLFPVDRGGGNKQTTLNFAHFVNGTWITDLVFVNLSTEASRPAPTPFHTDVLPSRPAIYFYDTAGNPIAAESVVDITGDLEITEDGALTVQTEMEPLGVLTISTHGRGELVSGSVRVVSDGPIGGMLRFEHPALGVAGVGASPPLSDALFPVRRQEGGITTGVALHNLESSPGLLRCDLMREGVLLDAASIPLEANGQTAWLIDQAFPAADTSDFTGSVRCDAVGEGLFSAVALEMDPGNRIFATLPVVSVPEMPDRE